MSFTVNKKLSAQAAASASGTWGAGGTTGVDVNTGVIGPLDTILGGLSTFSVSSSNVSLTFTAGGGGDVSNAYWRFSGVLLQSIVVSPTAGDATTYLNGYYLWSNTTSGSFTITLTTADGSVVLPQGRRGILYVSTANTVAPVIVAMVGSGSADPIPAASKMMFYNASAPSGWTAVALNDYGIKIVTNGGGAVASGSVAYSTLFARTATDSYTLLTADIPSHTHTLTTSGTVLTYAGSTANLGASGGALVGGNNPTIANTGGGGSHSHAIDMRVQTAAFVLASRD